MSDNIKYTAEDIRLYLEGKMSPDQMHALETAALSDPFLADAIEGMEMHGNKGKFNADVDELRARLKVTSKKRKGALASINNLWWKIAAVLFIVITGVAVIFFTAEKNKTEHYEIAKTENKRDGDDKKLNGEQVPGKEAITDSETKENEIRQEEKKDVKDESRERERVRGNPPVAKSKEPVLFNKAEQAETEKDEESNVQRELAAPKKPSAVAATVADSVSKPEAMARAEIQNQTKVAKQLEGRAAGIAVERSEEPDSMFDEVVVVGYGIKGQNNAKSKTVSAGRSERKVIPGNGWDEFEKYIEDSTKINNADSLFTGEEHLSFTIGDDGLPESIKILRSISPSHDKEAIRLLQNGPSWKVAKGRKKEIRLKIIF
jgi:hypothetical protein